MNLTTARVNQRWLWVMLMGIVPTLGGCTPGFTTTDSGLKYRILNDSNGRVPISTSIVEIDYIGTLDDGTVFDSSYQKGQPLQSPVSRFIPGWKEGLLLVGEGGKIELEVPPSLAYGKRGAGKKVPPNATLHFVIELHKVK
jgi:FKBP-type peptidyl-prolyl cis-trans isomerase